jgi:uncharacterized membrane protein (DUF2068 family)/Flp pilus assembly pilin Flp
MAHQRHHLTRWDDLILRVIAVYHLLKSAFFFALGFGLRHLLHRDLDQFLKNYVIEPFKLDPSSHFLSWALDKVSEITQHELRTISYLFFSYGVLFAIEGVGLYLKKRWAEFMVVIVVSSLVPFEFYEICLSLAWWKLLLMAGNLLVVGFLCRRLVLEEPKDRNGHRTSTLSRMESSERDAPRGRELTKYVIILVIISVVIVGVLLVLGSSLKGVYTTMSTQIAHGGASH